MSTITKDLGVVTAYGYYKAGGGTMTESEFTQFMVDFGTASQTATEAAQAAAESAQASAAHSADAQDSADEARQSASTASAKATEATTAAGASIDAQTAAETAQGKAEDAQAAAAQSASEAAESARTLTIDDTLTQSGQAADSKAVGDEVKDLKADLGEINSRINTSITPNWMQGSINSNGQVVQNDALKYTSEAIRVTKDHVYTVGDNNPIYRIKFYANEPVIGTVWPTSQTIDIQTSYIADSDGWIAIVVFNANVGDVVDALPESVTLNSLDHRITGVEDKADTLASDYASVNEKIEKASLKNPLVFTNANCFKSLTALGTCTVGSPVAFVVNSSRNVCRLTIADTFNALHVMYAVGASQIAAVITDADGSVLKMYTATETTRRRLKITWSDVSNAKYIYWCSLSGKNAKALCDFTDEYVICHGNRVEASVSTAVECADLIEGKKALLCDISSESNVIEITYSEQDGDFTVGLWIKVPKYEDVGRISSILINVYTGATQIHNTSFYANFLQTEQWAFIKLPMLNGNLTHSKIKLTFTLVSGFSDSITVLVSPFIITNHYLRPTYIMNNDQLWGASETCGYYDYMIENQMPFTVTGKNSVSDPVSAEMLATLNECYKSGLLDVGVYTNELPDTYPISINATSYIDVMNAMEHIIDEKIQSGYYPVSIGCGNHRMPPAIRKTIENSEYKAVRGGFAQGDRLSVLSNTKGMLYQTQDIISYIQSLGGVCFMFAHGFSNNPSAETNPALYSNWSTSKARMDTVVSLRDAGELLCVNMKQWAELTKDIKLI